MKTKTLILTLLTVALLLPAVALPASAVVGVYNCSLGDLNVDGKVNSIDYMILKRYVMKTHSLSDEHLYSADLNLDGDINALDYATLKRIVMKKFALDLSWTKKPYSEMTDEELMRAIRYSFVPYHEKDLLYIRFETGIGEVEARAMLETLSFYSQLGEIEFFGSSKLYCQFRVETLNAQKIMFALARLQGVEKVSPAYLSLPN